ncbi:MAG: hypothetical protein KDI46_02355 [Alphaproteobacteria bacterium]|nr:hypothetical protein [Alphaproteobacteria bacterium]
MNRHIQYLIEETTDAFARYDNVNADYASFACMAIADFKSALNAPHLTEMQLRRILRRGAQEHRARASSASSWSSFMARYVITNANQNTDAHTGEA